MSFTNTNVLLTDLKLGTLFFYKMKLPKTMPLDFENFVPPTKTNKPLLIEFTEKREALRRALDKGTDMDAIIVACEHYIPYAFSLYQFNGLIYPLVNMPSYSWKNHLTPPKDGAQQQPDISHYDQGRFEVVQVLHSLAAAYCNKAYMIVNAPLASSARIEHLQQASKLYFAAAGIFLFLRDNLGGPWKGTSSMTNLEVSSHMANLLVELCSVQVERLAIRFGIMKGDSYRALCSLSVNAFQRHALMRQYLALIRSTVQSTALATATLSDLESYIFYSEVYQEAMSFKLLGLFYREKQKVGKAISAMTVAIDKVRLVIKESLQDRRLTGTPLEALIQETIHREFEETEIALKSIERFQMEMEIPDLEYDVEKITQKLPLPKKDFMIERPYIPPPPRLRDPEGIGLEMRKETQQK